jgi:hypothetical protein
MLDKLDTFTRAYIKCALWSSTDESRPDGGDPLDKNYGIEDIAHDTLCQMIDECAEFQENNGADLACKDAGNGGHDFWLTRNRHGCGFWETPDWPEDVGERLTAAAHVYGEVNLYIGDDCLIYQG